MAKEKSIRQQVMEAGFGEMLERYGFTKVSPTQYKRDESLGAWRVALGKGFPKDLGPDSFRDGAGFALRGYEPFIDAFIERLRAESGWNHRRGLNTLPGTTIKVLTYFEVIGLMMKNDDGSEYPDPPLPPRTGFMAWLLGPERSRPLSYRRPKFVDRHPDAHWAIRNNISWMIREDRSVEDFAEDFCRYWEDTVAHKVVPTGSTDALLERYTASVRSRYIFNACSACTVWLSGRQDLVRDQFDQLEHLFSRPDEAFIDEWMNDPSLERERQEIQPQDPIEFYTQQLERLRRYQSHARVFMALAETWPLEP